jgi:hypothetical protein
MDCRIKSGNDDGMIQPERIRRLPTVIPGRAVSANPESSRRLRAQVWIPGPAFSRPGMTELE